jgi:hypothetical protein
MYIEFLSINFSFNGETVSYLITSGKNKKIDVFFQLGYEVYIFGLISSIVLKDLYNFIILFVSLQVNSDSIEQSKVIC